LFTINKPYHPVVADFLFPCCALFWPFMIFKQTIFDFLHSPSIFLLFLHRAKHTRQACHLNLQKKSIKFNVKNIHKKPTNVKNINQIMKISPRTSTLWLENIYKPSTEHGQKNTNTSSVLDHPHRRTCCFSHLVRKWLDLNSSKSENFSCYHHTITSSLKKKLPHRFLIIFPVVFLLS